MADTTEMKMEMTPAYRATLPEQKIREQTSKLTLANMGMPALVNDATKRDAQGRYYVGRIVGRVDSLCERTSPKDQTKFEGLEGNFIFIPSEPGREELESGVMFIPDAFHNLIAEQFREAIAKDAGASIEFVLNVYSIQAKNPAGYSWVMKPVVPFVGKHPLDNMLALAAAADKKLLEAPKGAPRK